jgi:hypothetical protein
MVAHCEGSPQIHRVISGRLVKEVGLGLDALALLRAIVRTHVCRREGHAVIGKMRDDSRVHAVDLFQRDDAPRDPRLIRHEEQ